jgi:hypothetical protein
MWYKRAQSDQLQPSLFFEPWSEGSEIRDNAGKSMPVYHGTTHELDKFDIKKTSPNSYYGQGFYFTDSPKDASFNYANPKGADIEGKIADVLDSLLAKYEESTDELNNDFGFNEDKEWTQQELEEFLRMKATEQIVGNNQGNILPAYVKMKNPINLSPQGGTYLEYEYDEDDNGDIIEDSERGTLIDFTNAFKDAANDYGLDGDEALRQLEEKIELIDASAYKVFMAIKENEWLMDELSYVAADMGKDSVSGDFVSDIIQRMGYDGIIMDAYSHFGPRKYPWGSTKGMEHITPKDRHYVVWNPNQIKSAIGNTGWYNPENSSILG